MLLLLKNARVVNVYTDEILSQDILIDDHLIIGVGDYSDVVGRCDQVRDLGGAFVCPGFIDGHIHVESTQMTPANLARVALPHGTTGIVCDPHEIANVCGIDGINYMLQASEGLPMDVYVTVPSCVPSSPFDEPGAVLSADDLLPLYDHPRVVGLAEVMDFPGVCSRQPGVLKKISDARAHGLVINGHAPLLTGHDLDFYIAQGIRDEHECSQYYEALERLRKGQTLMIREGTAARNLNDLLPFFDGAFSDNCILVSDDRDADTLINRGHIDDIIRQAVAAGKNPVVCIRMASYQAALHFRLFSKGAVAPGYDADLLIVDDLFSMKIRDVYKMGKIVVRDGEVVDFETPRIDPALMACTEDTVHLDQMRAEDFFLPGQGLCNVLGVQPGQIITDIRQLEVSGPDPVRDIAKVAVVERHRRTGLIGMGYVQGMGLPRGAIASTVSHDSHNLIVVGMDDESMATAADHCRCMGGGICVVLGDEVLAFLPLQIAGLMSHDGAIEVAAAHRSINAALRVLGVPEEYTPFMTMAFISLPVIPAVKITARGLVDVTNQRRLPLWVEQ